MTDGNQLYTSEIRMAPNTVQMRKDGDTLLGQVHWDGTRFQVLLKDNAATGDTRRSKIYSQWPGKYFSQHRERNRWPTREVRKAKTYNNIV